MEKKKVLVVDDEEGIRNFIKQALELKGHDVFCCANGMIALEIIQNGCYLPHLVITDILMPEMNGNELTKKIKDKFPKLPVILMTGTPDEVNETTGKLADGIFIKPFYLEKLFRAVNNFL